MQIFDSHAHYDDKKFDCDRDEILSSLPLKGVCAVLNCASDINSAKMSIELAEKYPYIYAAVGIHPHEADTFNSNTINELKELAKHPKVAAIGEIGLDYHYDFSPREIQREALKAQIKLAKELLLPVVLHDREAHEDMYKILREFAPLRGVMHCFSGSAELAKESVKMGLHIGLGGAVTFKNAKTPLEVAKDIPLERLLLETDAPYMSPVPYRGKRCDSSMIPLAAESIAGVRGISADEVLAAARVNASKLFKI